MEAADEIQKETIIKDDDVALGNGDVSSSADLSLEEPSPGLHFRIIMNLLKYKFQIKSQKLIYSNG